MSSLLFYNVENCFKKERKKNPGMGRDVFKLLIGSECAKHTYNHL
jgi:hypothetical protein